MGNCHFCGKFVGDSNMGCVLELYPASLEDPAENALVCADHINGIEFNKTGVKEQWKTGYI